MMKPIHLNALDLGPRQMERFPLSTDGRYIVDARNERFKLKSVNWYGANLERQVVAGLEYQSLEHITDLIQQWGFNSVRLTFSNMMLHDSRPAAEEWVRANPQLIGKTPLEVFDATIEALTRAGIAVILNNHSTFSEWCCGFDYNGLWYHTGSSFAYNQTTQMWQEDWLMLVKRYKHNKLVVGADLRNEVRTMRLGDTHIPESPNWGWGNRNDWHKAAQEVGQLIHQNHPDLLIIVEGINWWGTIPLLGSGERPHLKPVKDLPIRLRLPNKLVYAAHNYDFTGPNHNGDDKTSKGNIKYGEMNREQLFHVMDEEFGFVVEAEKYFTAPVWVSEFGAFRQGASESSKQWFRHLVDYLIEKDLDFAYWPLNHEGYGLVSADWSHILTNDWRFEHLSRLLSDYGKQGFVQEQHYTSLSLQKSDDNQSSLDFDWLAGARKGTCPDGYRLTGLSGDYRGLCTDAQTGSLRVDQAQNVVQAIDETPERFHNTGDWAGGFTKYECPQNYYVAGFSKHYWGVSGILCAPSQRLLSNQCRTLWFDRGDQRDSFKGGDWAVGAYKGQCRDDEYVGGIAQRSGKASALLCCSLN
ncbi:MAG: glycoside hydrolase family 5 protein [Oligoflexus sp.]